MKYSVCRILRAGNCGTGFFCELPYKSKLLPFLITNNHILDYEYIKNNKKIKISLINNKEQKTIKINKNRIIITNKDLDYTLIEIKPDEDDIDINKCLKLEKNICNIDEQYLYEMYSKKNQLMLSIILKMIM